MYHIYLSIALVITVLIYTYKRPDKYSNLNIFDLYKDTRLHSDYNLQRNIHLIYSYTLEDYQVSQNTSHKQTEDVSY